MNKSFPAALALAALATFTTGSVVAAPAQSSGQNQRGLGGALAAMVP